MSATVPNTDVDRVREAVDLVGLIAEYIQLRPKGREHVGLCPFHDDHTPSLAVVTHKGNAFYKCHACGAAGDALNFMMAYHGMSFPEALEFLAARAGIALHRRAETARRAAGPGPDELRRANALAAAFYRSALQHSPQAAAARAMVAARGISEESAQRFGIGASPPEWESLVAHAKRHAVGAEALAAAGLLKPRASGGHYDTFRNRLMFPIFDELGRAIAFGGRQLLAEDEPKYLNSPESPVFSKSKTLYGLHLARRAIIDSARAIVTEGYTDVVACHQAGFTNVVATLGTSLTIEHARLLRRLCACVVLLFDGDEAGQRAADRAIELFFAEPIDLKICVLPCGDDPADLLGRPGGAERFRAALDGACDAMAFKVGRFRQVLREAGGPGARQQCLEKLLAELADLGFEAMPGVRKAPVVAQLAGLLGVRHEDIEQALPQRRRQSAGAAAAAAGTAGSALWTSDPDLPAARRRAERELLAALICHPALRSQTLESGRPVAEAVGPASFQDPMCRRLAEAVWASDTFTVQQLMARLDDPALRAMAGELYLDGERQLASGDQTPAEALRERCAALDRLNERHRYRQDLEALRQTGLGAQPAEALRDMLDRRRRQGYIPEAIPARQRSLPARGHWS